MNSKFVSSKTQVKVKAFIEETWNSETYRDRSIEGELIEKLPL
jgi:hypothetical protein